VDRQIQRIVLVVEDVKMSGRIARLMSRKNLEVVTCDEPEGVRALLTSGPIDILIFDLRRSLALARHMANNYPETVLVGLDIHSDPHTVEQAQKIGVSIILESFEVENLGKASKQGSVQHFERLEDFLDKHDVSANLQPIVKLEEPEEIIGLESLARPPRHLQLWNPETLFTYAARKEHLFETDFLCLDAAFKEAKQINKLKKLFVNLRPRSVTHPDFVAKLLSLVAEHKYKAEQLVFELTEQQSILNLKKFLSNLKELREAGYEFALDDFGTGFANLEWLYQLKPDYLKIAGIFCRDLAKNKTKQVIVKAITQMAKSLKIPTVLENIENKSELEAAITLGVDYGQGYLFCKPAPARELIKQGIL